jgi:hypothetical protein
VLRRKCVSRKRGPEAENRHGGAPRGAPPSSRSRMYPASATHRVPNSGEPEFGREAGTLARCLACSVIAGRGCPLAPERLSALRPPLDRGGQGQGSGAIASRERDGLFDIVKMELSWPASAFARRRADKLGRDM